MAPPLPFRLPGLAVGSVRRRLADDLAHLVVGDREPVRDLTRPIEGDPGLFGPESVTWQVHSDASMFAAGVRALMLQTMHPLAMAGVAEHSDYRADPLGRLGNTATYVGTVTYGTREQAEAAVALVKRVHRRVVGTARDGRPYAANDPHLLTWVHHTLVDSFLRSYQRYGAGTLSPAEADRYVEEMAVLCELFDAEPAARSVAELRRYFADVRPELKATREAGETIRFLLLPPLPLVARPPYAVLAAAAVTMLPRWVRRQLWLPVPPAVEPLVVRPATTAFVRAVDWVMSAPRPPSLGDLAAA
jgi:uncharacterized protein (DUF2236 family)